MTDNDDISMTDDECAGLLDIATTGVLSLTTSADEPPHSIPVSFGYDPVDSVLYFRLAHDPDSKKGTLQNRPVSFVTYEYNEENNGWQSVVATGKLERTTNSDIELETLEGLERVTIHIVDIFGEPTKEVDFSFFRLNPDTLTGRKEAPMGQ